MAKGDILRQQPPSLASLLSQRPWTGNPALAEAALLLADEVDLRLRHKALRELPSALAPTVELPELKALQHLQRLNGPQAIGAYARAQIGLGNRFEAEQSVAIRRVYETLPREWQGLAAAMSLGPIPSRSPHEYVTPTPQADDPWNWLLLAKEFLRKGNNHLALLAMRRSLALGLMTPRNSCTA